jgi:hypothetical protein
LNSGTDGLNSLNSGTAQTDEPIAGLNSGAAAFCPAGAGLNSGAFALVPVTAAAGLNSGAFALVPVTAAGHTKGLASGFRCGVRLVCDVPVRPPAFAVLGDGPGALAPVTPLPCCCCCCAAYNEWVGGYGAVVPNARFTWCTAFALLLRIAPVSSNVSAPIEVVAVGSWIGLAIGIASDPLLSGLVCSVEPPPIVVECAGFVEDHRESFFCGAAPVTAPAFVFDPAACSI